MPTVQHPAFPEITHEVDDDKLAAHLAQGWLLLEDDAENDEPQTSVQVTEPFNSNEPHDGLDTATNDTDEPEHVVRPRRRR